MDVTTCMCVCVCVCVCVCAHFLYLCTGKGLATS
jgi:hypothetical protein